MKNDLYEWKTNICTQFQFGAVELKLDENRKVNYNNSEFTLDAFFK